MSSSIIVFTFLNHPFRGQVFWLLRMTEIRRLRFLAHWKPQLYCWQHFCWFPIGYSCWCSHLNQTLHCARSQYHTTAFPSTWCDHIEWSWVKLYTFKWLVFPLRRFLPWVPQVLWYPTCILDIKNTLRCSQCAVPIKPIGDHFIPVARLFNDDMPPINL